MPSEARASRVVAAVREGLCAWALAVYRWPRLTLLVGIIAAGASVLALAQLSIDSNIMLLLAPQQPSVRALARYRAATGGLGAHIVLARSSGGAAERTIARRFISVLARNLRGDPLIEHVASGDPVAFFEARSAYYLSLVELRRLQGQLTTSSAR